MNKSDLREREKTKYGKWATNTVDKPCNPMLYKKIETQNDIACLRNVMVRKGNYPVSIPDCYVVGINGDCGLDCPVHKQGECPEPEGFESREGMPKE